MHIANTIQSLRENFNSGITRSLNFRLKQLNGLARFISECEDDIINALNEDLGKSKTEVLFSEILLLSKEIKLTQKKLSKWVKPKRVCTSLAAQPGKSFIAPEPLGVVLIISPWNYPIQLTLLPLVGALAAGNCIIIKPSEIANATSKLLATKLPNYIDPACLSVIEGGVDITTELLNQPFDYIFYTGNSHVGRIVMTAAAKHLTPITLELGGKSPCIIDKDTDISIAAKRIAWAKYNNAGQTCVAPDYVLVHESIEADFLKAMEKVLHQFYGNNPKTSPDYGRIINQHHFERLMKLLPGSGDIFLGGKGSAEGKYFEPTILHNVPYDSPIMNEEIFGPILPVIRIKDINDAIEFINQRPKPLSLYLFSSNRQIQQEVIARTSTGSVSINFPMLQLAVSNLPFGGIGESGMGKYHGKATFDTFTHYKSVLIKPIWFDLSFFYPPYGKTILRVIRWLM